MDNNPRSPAFGFVSLANLKSKATFPAATCALYAAPAKKRIPIKPCSKIC
jgi:hypothetical protein